MSVASVADGTWTIKKSKAVRIKTKDQPTLPVNAVKRSNRFEVLVEENCEIKPSIESDPYMNEKKKMKTTCTKSQPLEAKKKENTEIKRLRILKSFETKNRFTILEDNSEDEIKEIINISKIKMSPKHLLKKCKHCNFKKRSCQLNQTSCMARQQNCTWSLSQICQLSK